MQRAVHDPETVRQLGDERLQQLLTSINTSKDRERVRAGCGHVAGRTMAWAAHALALVANVCNTQVKVQRACHAGAGSCARWPCLPAIFRQGA
jgi:hypothetical protein